MTSRFVGEHRLDGVLGSDPLTLPESRESIDIRMLNRTNDPAGSPSGLRIRLSSGRRRTREGFAAAVIELSVSQ